MEYRDSIKPKAKLWFIFIILSLLFKLSNYLWYFVKIKLILNLKDQMKIKILNDSYLIFINEFIIEIFIVIKIIINKKI